MELGKERIKSEGSKRLMEACHFLEISRRNRVPNNRFLFKFRSNKVKYNIYRYSRDDENKVELLTRPSNLIHGEDI
jgi:hypothetical protein